MTLSLATRGYLCSTRGSPGPCPPYGPGPTLIGIEEESPIIGGAAVMRIAGPTLTGSGAEGPSIRKAATPPTVKAAEAPTITGAGSEKPDIKNSGRS